MDPASTIFVLGYHGCDRSVAERVFAGADVLAPSHNDYDWLADGIYFWEHNATRAFDFARELRDQPRNDRQRIEHPAVVGAVIDLGLCLNLLDARFIRAVRASYDRLIADHRNAGTSTPTNSADRDILRRGLDCAVVRNLHNLRADTGVAPFDTVRAAYVEGGPLYETAGFAAKNHIQVCVRNPAAIQGYFRPLGTDGRPAAFP